MRENSPQDYVLDGAERGRGESLSSLNFALSYLKPYGKQLVLALLSILLAAATVISLGWGFKYLIDVGFQGDSYDNLTYGLLILFALVILMAIASYGRSYYVSWLGEKVTQDIRTELFKHMLKLDLPYFENVRSGELISRLLTDTTLIQIVVGTSGAVALRNILLVVGGLAMMIITSAELSLGAAVIVTVIIVPIIVFGKGIKQKSRQAQASVGHLSGYVEEVVGNIRTSKIFNHESHDLEEFSKLSDTVFSTAEERIKARAWMACLVMSLVFAGVCAIFWFGGKSVISSAMSGGALSMFIFYTVLTAGAIGSFSEIIADLGRASGACERLQELLGQAPVVEERQVGRAIPKDAKGIVAIHNVDFAYPSCPEKVVLQDVSITVPPASKVAIVGPSGAGKSTIFALLQGFYAPTAGKVHVEGIDVSQLNRAALRQHIGLVPQDPVIFSATLKENILYGKPDASDTQMYEAISQAYLTDVVDSLPEGLNTFVGVRGVKLSGGQRQRIAIARALLRSPKILLLDEATNSLDAKSESYIQSALRSIQHERTTITIAHRLATVKEADIIVVLDQGRVVASGTHATLLTTCELYKKLAELQFYNGLD